MARSPIGFAAVRFSNLTLHPPAPYSRLFLSFFGPGRAVGGRRTVRLRGNFILAFNVAFFNAVVAFAFTLACGVSCRHFFHDISLPYSKVLLLKSLPPLGSDCIPSHCASSGNNQGDESFSQEYYITDRNKGFPFFFHVFSSCNSLFASLSSTWTKSL